MSHYLLKSKTAAITGATTGIGRAIALEYVRQGCNVVVNHLGLPSDLCHKTSLLSEATAIKDRYHQAGRLIEIAGDISKPDTGTELINVAVRKFGGLDILVSNAGICQFAKFLEIEHDLFASTVNTNLNGAFYVCQAAARQMAAQKSGGSIIGISSISALVGGGLQTHYTPTKAGVHSLMQSMAVALGKYRIRCNSLLPGTIMTQLSEKDLEVKEKREYMESRIPMGRIGEPKDLAGPAVFLASEELSGYVNGSQLLVDGGLFVNLQ
ncbi:L-rhamnose-1-dehydrogenase [Golovinomyces cichoracearum]|uniref:L-rhamnose-1-dehydrogenase n=1 Tax=Golovinomyces cichoracearum TaxID=62708 RepID=A0A420H8W8_9PEZI|nr:L-rhamnose-1-dehydrogenase [Golovinomyces cichoracearum]